MQILVEKEAEDFLEKEGFPVAERTYCKTSKEAIRASRKIKYPVAMKVVSKKVLHKTEAGGVILDIKGDKEVQKSFNFMKKIKGFEGVLIQDYTIGLFILLGLKKDPTFGPVVTVGTGGIFTEILRDVSFRVCPITKQDADEMIKELKLYKILKGFRGKKYASQKVISTLIKLSKLSQKYPKIKELDINPLIATEKQVSIVDARIVFE
tara:strand:- start:768 stop:1391 length:624 start_codon:yes stop_codon:yes gene_type:complete